MISVAHHFFLFRSQSAAAGLDTHKPFSPNQRSSRRKRFSFCDRLRSVSLAVHCTTSRGMLEVRIVSAVALLVHGDTVSSGLWGERDGRDVEPSFQPGRLNAICAPIGYHLEDRLQGIISC